ncbi:hypothetical protein BH09PLA1_BH09PLA1_23180 [soil metagenome]
MATLITVDHGDGTSFVGVSNETMSQDGTGGNASILFAGTGWIIAAGQGVQVKSSHTTVLVGGSKVLVQNFAAVGSQPTTTRYLLVAASSGGYVTPIGGSDEYEFSAGQFIDVVNSTPPVVGSAQNYSASAEPATASTLASAEQALTDLQS